MNCQVYSDITPGAKVRLLRVPDGGIQPQVASGRDGTLHLVWFKGDPAHGDLYYARQKEGMAAFSKPVRVNQTAGSAIAVGTIRGAQIALGAKDQPHIIWNGSGSATNHQGSPLLYTRMNKAGDAFEPERDIIVDTANLDGGSSVAADAAGRVYVVWHAHGPGVEHNEDSRAVFVSRSEDGGKTFQKSAQASPGTNGVCACCGLKASVDDSGALLILYRAEQKLVNRDEMLLVSRDHGTTFTQTKLHPWQTAACPMSSSSLSTRSTQTIGAWESGGQVFYRNLSSVAATSATISAPGSGKRRQPAAVANQKGEVLLAWTEGTGWARGGGLAWQVFDAEGRPTSEAGSSVGVPVWGLVAVAAKSDGSFVIIY